MEKKEIVYGRNTVLEYLSRIKDSGSAILYISDSAHGKIINTIINNAKTKRVKIEFCGKEYLSKFESSSRHQGVILELRYTSETSGKSSALPSIEEFLKTTLEKNGLIVLLDQLQDPHNVGSIIRTTEALGGNGVVLTKSHSADITSTVAKTSSGATAHLPLYTVSNAASFIDNAKKIGFWIIGTSGEGSTDLSKLKGLHPAVIIIGSEGTGMRRLTEEKCDFVARIPLKGIISSLNASVAAGIILYEALKD